MAPKVIFIKLKKNDERLKTTNKISSSCPYHPALWSLIPQLNLAVFLLLLLLLLLLTRYIWPASWAGLGFDYRRKKRPKATPEACCKKPLCVVLLVQSVFLMWKKIQTQPPSCSTPKSPLQKPLEYGAPIPPPSQSSGVAFGFFFFCTARPSLAQKHSAERLFGMPQVWIFYFPMPVWNPDIQYIRT